MKCADALKALDDAFATRVDHMFQILADSYAGSPAALTAAQKHFSDGIAISIGALAFASSVIEQNFKEQ